MNAIRGAEISIFISTKEDDEVTNLEDSASDKEIPLQKKNLLLPKVQLQKLQ